jgi:hypothetical protein
MFARSLEFRIAFFAVGVQTPAEQVMFAVALDDILTDAVAGAARASDPTVAENVANARNGLDIGSSPEIRGNKSITVRPSQQYCAYFYDFLDYGLKQQISLSRGEFT